MKTKWEGIPEWVDTIENSLREIEDGKEGKIFKSKRN